MNNKIYELPDEKFIELIKTSHNISEVLFKLKLSVSGNTWGYNQVKERMGCLGLTASDLLGRKTISKKQKEREIKSSDLLKENCSHQRCVLRKHILTNKLLPYKCAVCGIDIWQGKPISLELDHINGINNDNRIENLRFLCPNCHSQPITYGSKNQKENAQNFRIDLKQEKEIINLYKKYKNVKEVLKNSNYTSGVIMWVLKKEKILGNLNQKFVIRYNKDHKEIMRWGTITEAVKYLFDSGVFRTTCLKTARNTFLRNYNKFWLDSYWEIKNVYEA